MTSNNNNSYSNNNRSWLSSSSFGSTDDLSHEDPHNTSSALNNSTFFGSARKASRGGDRYNHYRRDGPSNAKVRPWMRDKAVTGSSRLASASSAFRSGSRPLVLSEATSGSVGSTKSCDNSVSSQSSFPEQQRQQLQPLPREVAAAPTTPISNRSLLTQPEEDQQTQQQDVSMLTLKEDVSMMTTTSVSVTQDESEMTTPKHKQQSSSAEQQHTTTFDDTTTTTSNDLSPRVHMAEDTQSVQSSVQAVQDPNATVEEEEDESEQPPSLVSSTEENEEVKNKPAQENDKDNKMDNDEQPKEEETTPTEAVAEADPVLVDVDEVAESFTKDEEEAEEFVKELAPPSTPAAKEEDNATESVPVVVAESPSKDESENGAANAQDAESESATATSTETPASRDEPPAPATVAPPPPITQETPASTSTPILPPAQSQPTTPTTTNNNSVPILPTPVATATTPTEEFKKMREHDHVMGEEKSQKEEVYDVLVPVEPTSYNPMGFNRNKTNDQPTSVAAYASLEKPTPLVKEQAAFLNDAIHEVGSDEEREESFDDDDEEDETYTTAQNLSTDSLQGIKALDTTHEESVLEGALMDEEEIIIEEEVIDDDDELNLSAEEDEFYKMWPKSVDQTNLPPEVELPGNWNEQQMLAVAATQTWIRSQQTQPIGSPSKEDPKSTYISYFAAALSDCPAVSTAFYATDNDNGKQWFCFCPCSSQMGVWRSHRLSAKEEAVLFGGAGEDAHQLCEDQQYTAEQLVQHCQAVGQNDEDPDSRFLHSVVHKYLEALFGEKHQAFCTPVDSNTVAVSKEVMEELERLRVEVTRVKESNDYLDEQLKVAEGKVEKMGQLQSEVDQVKSSNEDLVSQLKTAEDKLEEMGQLKSELESVKESKEEVVKKLKVAEEQNLVHEAKSISAAMSAEAQTSQIKDLTDASQTLATTNQELLEKLKTAEEHGKAEEAKNAELTKAAEEHAREIKDLSEASQALAASNQDLLVKLKTAEEKGEEYEAKSLAASTSSDEHAAQVKTLKESTEALEKENAELKQKLEAAEKSAKDHEEKHTAAAASATEQSERLKKLDEAVLNFSKSNAEMTETLRSTEEKLKAQEARNADAVASSEAQAEMMKGLCDELKKLEQTKSELEQKLKDAEANAKEQEEKLAAVTTAENEALERIRKLEVERNDIDQNNQAIAKKLKAAEEREKERESRDEDVCVVNVGDMSVDLRRFQVQCQRYFSTLRVVQLKSHCVRDKSPAKFVVPYNPKDKKSIDIQALLDKGAAIESQDPTYLFRALDTFNKGHFHTYKLLLPWKIQGGDGKLVSREAFFTQVWEQLGTLKVNVGEKKTEIPLFQNSLGTLIPMPNAVLEGMLRVTPAELDRIFAARLAPYYRAIGRLFVQAIGATMDDGADYRQKISGSALPFILRQKLFRGVDPVDESYPLEQLLDHAFSLLGMEGMTRDKAFEYFSIEAKNFNDTAGAVQRIREEVHEMWIKERSLALKALEEGLTLNGLADMSFCCGLVPLEAVNEVIFSSQ